MALSQCVNFAASAFSRLPTPPGATPGTTSPIGNSLAVATSGENGLNVVGLGSNLVGNITNLCVYGSGLFVTGATALTVGAGNCAAQLLGSSIRLFAGTPDSKTIYSVPPSDFNLCVQSNGTSTAISLNNQVLATSRNCSMRFSNLAIKLVSEPAHYTSADYGGFTFTGGCADGLAPTKTTTTAPPAAGSSSGGLSDAYIVLIALGAALLVALIIFGVVKIGPKCRDRFNPPPPYEPPTSKA